MYKKPTLIVLVVLLLITFTELKGDDNERIVVPLTNPSKPGSLTVEIFKGDITVTGYKGKEVVVEVETRKSGNPKAFKRNPKAAGMKVIPINSPGVEIEEQNNFIKIGSNSFNASVDLKVKVPFKTSLILKTSMDGDIKVHRIKGNIEVEKMIGRVYMTGIEGNVVASVNNGDLKVEFDKADFSKPMSFSTFNGDVDLTFPSSISCNIKASLSRGNFYSDFDIKRGMGKTPKGKRQNGKYKIKFDDFHGAINKGGQQMILKTFTGDIYLRKKK